MEFGGHEEHCERYIVGSVARRAEDLALLLVLFQLSLSKMLESIISTVPARTTRSLALALPSIAHRRLAACFYRSRLLCNMVVVADGAGSPTLFGMGAGSTHHKSVNLDMMVRTITETFALDTAGIAAAPVLEQRNENGGKEKKTAVSVLQVKRAEV
eukprot:CAMPEP_0198126874 /NCGR_PEP_ID=MMETSP1442-20131203/45975_1 /TAXON_ID= /ORGANISM="Craspedostauros australis, Strain CCMP3328" /LENGTH=156 /DNA_ID=CAMNT_0043786767 /DNA_START=314 /DNA_END=785 /DNA_ORIENTATION=-